MASKWGLVADRLLDLAASFSAVLTRIQVFVRRLLELHIFKLVALYTVWVALKEVSVPTWAVSSSEAGSLLPGFVGCSRACWVMAVVLESSPSARCCLACPLPPVLHRCL